MAEEIKFDDEMVRVRLVCDRPEKNDCRAYTKVVWRGQGDIQSYPKRLWPKLAPHPDVWALMPSAEDERIAAQKRLADAAAALKKAQDDAEAAEREVQADAQRRAQTDARLAEMRLATEKQEAAGTNTDVVNATPTQAALEPLTELTADELNALPDEDVKALAERRDYGLHPRLNSVNLRARFIEAQDAQFEALAADKPAST